VETDTLVELPSRLQPLTSIRSTVLQSSLVTLKDRNHFEHYVQLLDESYRAEILETLAPEWLPGEVGLAHYAACDALDLSPRELHTIGEEVGERIQGRFITLLLHNAHAAGLTPWVPLGQYQRLYERLVQGGGVRIVRVGLQEAVVDLRRLALCKFAYFRAAFCGVLSSLIKLGSGRSPSVRVDNASGYELRCAFKCAWE
jgi:hypothetical protein